MFIDNKVKILSPDGRKKLVAPEFWVQKGRKATFIDNSKNSKEITGPLYPRRQPVPSRKNWKNMKNPSKKDLQNGNVSDIMINGLFSKGVKRRESKIFRKTDLRKM